MAANKPQADLRKAAILITALDSASGDALLEQMPPAVAQRVRDTIMDLEDISPAEQQKVLADFLGRGGVAGKTLPKPNASVDVELELSEEAIQKQPPSSFPSNIPDHTNSGNSREVGPFDFLAKVAGKHIANVLQTESPQAVAAVIASLDPQHAAEVLELLPTDLSIDALARMANLSEMVPIVLQDLAAGLKEQLAPHLQAQNIRKESLAGIQRVLSALDGDRRKALLTRLGKQNSPLVQQLGYLTTEDEAEVATATVLKPNSYPGSFNYVSDPIETAEISCPTASVAVVKSARPAVKLPPLTNLFALPLETIKHVFAEVSAEVAVMALIGSEPKQLEKFLLRLPAAVSKDLRHRLAHPGPIRLRDLDRAQIEVRLVLQELAEGSFASSNSHELVA